MCSHFNKYAYQVLLAAQPAKLICSVAPTLGIQIFKLEE